MTYLVRDFPVYHSCTVLVAVERWTWVSYDFQPTYKRDMESQPNALIVNSLNRVRTGQQPMLLCIYMHIQPILSTY